VEAAQRDAKLDAASGRAAGGREAASTAHSDVGCADSVGPGALTDALQPDVFGVASRSDSSRPFRPRTARHPDDLRRFDLAHKGRPIDSDLPANSVRLEVERVLYMSVHGRWGLLTDVLIGAAARARGWSLIIHHHTHIYITTYSHSMN
jgi:hypothetical protein